jgi:hypothetical protein
VQLPVPGRARRQGLHVYDLPGIPFAVPHGI